MEMNGVSERVSLWRNLINFTLLRVHCTLAGCRKSVQMINELINMRQNLSLGQLNPMQMAGKSRLWPANYAI